jgi:DNA-binding NtrC family response regulator
VLAHAVVKREDPREDLFYRIEIGTIRLPSLRERRSDIPLLALWGLQNINCRLKTPKRLSQEALDRLRAHEWPGNVRSLMNVIERAAISVRRDIIDAADIQFSEDAESSPHGLTAFEGLSLPDPAPGFRLDEYFELARRHLITRALEMANDNKTEAARLLGITPQAIHNYLRRKADEAADSQPPGEDYIAAP